MGSSIASLILSGSLATVSITVPATLQTATLPLYRSDDSGLTYSSIGTCTVGNNSLCTFTTNHFSLFALGMPSFPVSPGSNSSTSGPGGGGGGGTSSYSNSVSLDNFLTRLTTSTLIQDTMNVAPAIQNILPIVIRTSTIRKIKKMLLFIRTESVSKSVDDLPVYLTKPSLGTTIIGTIHL